MSRIGKCAKSDSIGVYALASPVVAIIDCDINGAGIVEAD